MFGWIYNAIFGLEKEKDATAPVPVSTTTAEGVKATPVPEANAKPQTAKRARPADADATPSGAPTKTAKTVSGKKVSHVEGDWIATFRKVDTYVKRVGGLDDIGEEEPALAEWLNRQQRNAATLTIVQKKQLDSIGAKDVKVKAKAPGAQGGAPKTPKTRTRTPKFEIMFERLLAFKIVYGDTQVPSSYEDGQLAKWARRQRLLYSQKERGLKDKLSNERIEQLNSIGFAWKLKRGRPKTPGKTKKGSSAGSD
jgi:hypothetical protein